MKPWQGQSECRIQGFGTNFYILVEPCFSLKVTIPKDASKPDGDAVENGALLSASELHARGHFVNSPSETEPVLGAISDHDGTTNKGLYTEWAVSDDATKWQRYC